MADSKILIIGSKGQLGTALKKQYPDAIAVDSNELDITDKLSVESFDWSGVDIIVNAAAYTNVDGAETQEGRTLAWSVNADAVANLVTVSAHYDITLVHISSDYVFDGTITEHTEDEAFAPLSVYGASKAAGDIAVSLAPKFYILRTSWVIGEGNNFVRTMISLAKKNISPKVVHDQIGRLTFTSELVRAIDHILTPIHQSPITNHPFGTYNVSNDGPPVSWADITREIFKLLNRNDLTVANTTTEEYFKDKSGVAPRPLQSTLNLNKIQSTGFKSSNWQSELKSYINQQTDSI